MSYIYSLATDFITSHAIGLIRFMNDIKTNIAITPVLSNIGIDGDNVTVTFASALSAPEELVLITIVANHVPGSLTFDSTAILKDVKDTGSNGGTFNSDTWVTRDLNVVEGNNVDLWLTLSSNSFTLKEGSYYIFGTCPTFNVGDNQLRLYNTSTDTVEFYGQNSRSGTTSQSRAYIEGTIVVPSEGNSYIIEHFCQNTELSDGLGMANGFGFSETYSIINIQKIL